MITVVIVMLAGMLAGYVFRKNSRLIRLSEKSVTYAIFALLFLLGIAIGADSRIMDNLHSLGLIALVLTLAGVLGSIMLAWLTFRLFFKNKEVKHEI